MGLLDAIKFSTGDPDKDAQLNRGLLQMGLQLMQSRGRLFPALGQAGAVGLQAADQTRQQQMQAQAEAQRRQMMGLQIGQAQRESQIAALPGQFYRAPSEPAVDATGGMETAAEAPNNASGPGGFDLQGYMQALKGMDFGKYLQTAAAMRTSEKPETVAPGATLGRYVNGKFVPDYVAPSPDKDKQLATPLQEYAQVVADYQAEGKRPPTFEQWDLSRKRAGATTISNAPYAGIERIVDADGNIRLVQPGSRPGQDPRFLIDPQTGLPAKGAPSGSGEPTEGERKAATLLSRLRFSQNQLQTAVQGNPSAALPTATAEVTRRVLGDTAAGAVTPQERQRVEAAQLDILDAALTLGTGAAYTREQLEGYRRSYFPVLTDDAKTIEDKKARLANLIKAAEIAAGKAAGKIAAPATAAPAASGEWSIKPKQP
jgi:hypothetical protein